MLKTKDGYAKVIGTSYNGSSDYLLLSNGDSKAISSLSVNYANDADKLDGYHENSFLRYRGDTSTDQEATLWSQIGIKKYTGALPDGLTGVYNYGSVISLPCDSSRFEIYASHQSSSGNGLYYRSGWNSDKKSWLKFIDSSNIGSQSVNYANSAGNADTVDGEHASSFVRAGVINTDATDLNALDTYSFIKSVNSKVADHSPKGNTGWYNVIQLVHRNGSGDGPGYIGQIALGMTTNTNDMFFRGKRTDSWKTVIHSGNIVDQSVKYATSAGNADTVDGQHASAFSYKSWWHWSGQSGQPSWIWGGNSENNYYVYNPSNFRVNYAKSAGSVAWDNVTGKPSTFAPSAHTHKWADITDHITKLSQLTNDKGFVTGSVSGNTITINDSSTTWSDTWRPITDNYELGESDTSLSSLGSLTLYNDLLGSIPNPTDYYWANVKISTSSNTQTTPTFNTAYATDWFRARGNSGFYFQNHGGGWYMSDNTWIRTWNSTALYVNNTIRSTNYQAMYENTSVSAAKLESATTLVYGTDTSLNSINTYLRGTTITLQVKKDTSINYNAFQVTADRIYCNNYCDMKVGAAVSGGNLTVQNNAYLAQKAGTKVGIGTSNPQSTLDIKGSGVAPLRVNGSIELCHDNTYLVQPLILAYGAYYGSNMGVSCSTPITVLSYIDQIVINFINIKKSSFTNDNFAFYMTPLDSSANISTYVRFNEASGPIVSVHIKNPVKLHQFSFILYVYQSKLKTYSIDFLS